MVKVVEREMKSIYLIYGRNYRIERIAKMYDILKDTGSFYLHCDWHASHYLKVMLDDIYKKERIN